MGFPFFTLLQELIDIHKFQSTNIFNMFEAGIATVSKRTSLVVTLKDDKEVNSG